MDELMRWAMVRYDEPEVPRPVKRDRPGRPMTERGQRIRMMGVGDSLVFDTQEEADAVSWILRRTGGKAEKRKSREGFMVRRIA